MNPAPPVTRIRSSPEKFRTAGIILFLDYEMCIVDRDFFSSSPDEFTERFTTIPVITGPVIVFNSVKNFCSSFSRALAT